MAVVLIVVIIILLLLIIESIIIKYNSGKIRIKIHINGTRGKSSVTKYICGGLEEVDLKVIGKITGEIPSILLPNNVIKKINRKGPARVQEQFNIINMAGDSKVDALVLECMSIDPALQKLESSFFKPDIYIITNIRDDHREKMGNTINSHVKSICNAIPYNSKIITGNSIHLETIKKVTLKRNSKFIQAVDLQDSEKNKLPIGTFESNVQLALTACLEANIPRKSAFEGILKKINTSESPLYTFSYKEGIKFFLNAFSVNDIQSFTDFLNFWTEKLSIKDNMTVIFNSRSDRPLRTNLFTVWIKSNHSLISKVLLVGDHKARAKRLLTKTNIYIKPEKMNLNSKIHIKQTILENMGNSKLIVGIGNIKGDGYKIINCFSEHHDY